jgi:hypothetical protein
MRSVSDFQKPDSLHIINEFIQNYKVTSFYLQVMQQNCPKLAEKNCSKLLNEI